MMKSVLFVALLVALASPSSALPADYIIPEDDVDLQETAYGDAVERVNSLLAEGNDHKACEDLAKSEKKAIQDSVNTNQKLLDDLPSGKECKNQGQELVSKTRNEKNRKRTQLTKAQGAFESAGNAQIDFGKRTFSSMTGTCAIAKSDGKYVAAKRVYDAAQKKVTIATAEHKAAEKAYNEAVAAAKKQMKECECDVQKTHASAWKKVNAANGSNQKGWTRATHMLCVVGGTSYEHCKTSSAPTVKKPPIDDGAKNAKCETAGASFTYAFAGECKGWKRQYPKGTYSFEKCKETCAKNNKCLGFTVVPNVDCSMCTNMGQRGGHSIREGYKTYRRVGK